MSNFEKVISLKRKINCHCMYENTGTMISFLKLSIWNMHVLQNRKFDPSSKRVFYLTIDGTC